MLSRASHFLSRKSGVIRQYGVKAAIRQFYDEHLFITTNWLLLTHDLSELVENRLIKRMAQKPIHKVTVITKMNQLGPLLKSYPEKKQAFERNIQDQTVGITISEGDNILAYNWIAMKSYYDWAYSKHEYQLQEDEVYQFDLFVDPQSRGALVTPQILSAVYNYCLNQGKKRILTAVDATNHPSLNIHLKLNFSESSNYLKIHQLAFFRWSKLLPHEKTYKSRFAKS